MAVPSYDDITRQKERSSSNINILNILNFKTPRLNDANSPILLYLVHRSSYSISAISWLLFRPYFSLEICSLKPKISTQIIHIIRRLMELFHLLRVQLRNNQVHR